MYRIDISLRGDVSPDRRSNDLLRYSDKKGESAHIRICLIAVLALFLSATMVANAAQGNLMWERQYGEGGSNEGQCVIQTQDGGYAIAGTADTVSNGSQIYLIKTDANGSIIWQKLYGEGNDSRGYAVAQANDGGYVIVGTMASISNGSQVAIVKTDAGGTVVWQNLYGGSGPDEGRAILGTKDGGFIIAGTRTPDPALDSSNKAFLMKINANGGIEWQNDYGFINKSTYGESVDMTGDGGYIIAGAVDADSSIGPGTQIYLAKVDANGTLEWQNILGEALPTNDGRSVRQTPDGGYIIAGTATYEGETPNGVEPTDNTVHVIKTTANGSKEWEQWFGNGASDPMYQRINDFSHGYAVVCSADGGYAVAGYTRPILNGGDYPAMFGNSQAYLVRMYPNGSRQWEANYGSYGDTFGYSLIQAQDGGYVIAGAVNTVDDGLRAYLVKTYGDAIVFPTSSFSSSTILGMAPLTVRFTDTSTGSPTSWQWNFGDGSANVTTRNASHTFQKPGTYNVALTVANGTMASTSIGTVYVRSTRITVDKKPGAGMFTDISSAIAYALPGDMVVVDSGYYRESLVVNKSIELAGLNTGGGLPVVDGMGANSTIRVIARNAAVHGFGVTGGNIGIFVSAEMANVSYNQAFNNKYAGIELYRRDSSMVLGNTANNNSIGIYLYDTVRNTIQGNNVRNNHIGIELLDSYDYNNIYGNKACFNDRYGIYLSSSDGNSVIVNNASYDGSYGIVLSGSRKNAIDNNLANGDFSGIYLTNGSTDNGLGGNKLYGDGTGLTVQGSDGNMIGGNYANASHYGILVSDANDNDIWENTADGNDHYGIYAYRSENTTIQDNKVGDNMNGGIVLYGSGNTTVSGNAAHNDHYGIYLYDSPGNRLDGNTADANAYNGIILYRSDDNAVTKNALMNNGYGIYMYNSTGNVLWSNSLENNGRSAFERGGTNHWNTTTIGPYVYNGYTYNNYTGNVWGDYRGPDGNGDGIGDIPYRIGADSVDAYPMLPASTMRPVKNLRTGLLYNTIQAAIDDANTTAGDTITVYSGIYGNVTVNKAISLVGIDTGSGLPVVDGNGKDNAIKITESGVSLQGFNATHAGNGVYTTGTMGNITGNILSYNFNGIYVRSRLNNLTGNTIVGNDVGIDVYSPDNRIANNSIYANDWAGIYLETTGLRTTVSGNRVDDNQRNGIWIDSATCNVTDNEVLNNTDNGIGLNGMSKGIRVGGNMVNNSSVGIFMYGNESIVSGNTVTGNYDGISLQSLSNNNTLAGNTITGNGYGMEMQGSSNNSITGNVIRSNRDAGIHNGGSLDNTIWLNVIVNNGRNGWPWGGQDRWNSSVPVKYTYNGQTYTGYAGNYWGDYSGTDANGDGIGDTPDRLDDYNVDYYPMIMATTNYTAYKAYITNFNSGNITVVDTKADIVVGSIDVGGHPSDVVFTPDGARAYVTETYDDYISVIDTATDRKVGEINVSSQQRGIAMAPDGKKAYIANQEGGYVSVIDTATNKRITAISTGNPVYVAVSPDGKKAYATNAKYNNVSVIDTATDEVSASIDVGQWPCGLAISPDGKKIYVADSNDNDVSVIDSATNAVIRSINFSHYAYSGPASPYYVSFTPDGSQAYVVMEGYPLSVVIIDTATDTIRSSIYLDGLPQQVAFTPDGKKAYVTNANGLTSVIDTASGNNIATIHGGAWMNSVAIK